MRGKIEMHSISGCMGDHVFLVKILCLALAMTFESNRRACAKESRYVKDGSLQ